MDIVEEVISDFMDYKRWVGTEEERSSMSARCVHTHLQLMPILNSTCLFILEKRCSAASSVNSPAHRLVASRHTC